MTPAASYHRVSGYSQRDGDGFERQDETQARYAAANNITPIIAFYEDFTGTESERPAFDAMLKWCAETGVSTILVERMDRLARKFRAGEVLIEMCRQQGLTVIDCSTGEILTDEDPDPDVWLISRMRLLLAEHDCRKIVYRTRKARERIRSRGEKCEGRKGYLDLPEFAPAVARITELHSQRLGLSEITDAMNASSLQTIDGGPWQPSTIRGVLARLGLKSKLKPGDLSPAHFDNACQRRRITRLSENTYQLPSNATVSVDHIPSRRGKLAFLIRQAKGAR